MVSIWSTVPSFGVHDEEVDYNGERLASCSSKHSIRIYDIKKGFKDQKLAAVLIGHTGPVWKITWAPAEFGTLLASCSYDGRVIIWTEKNNKWEKYFVYSGHKSSVNSVAFADHPFGLILACGSLDGSISILTHVPEQQTFEIERIMDAHQNGCNTVYWYPSSVTGYFFPVSSSAQGNKSVKRIASGGEDKLIKVWRKDGEEWIEESRIECHSNSVWDLAWAPLTGTKKNMIASCSKDRRVIVSTTDDLVTWTSNVLSVFDDYVWSVSWAAGADMLAVCGDEDNVSLWKMNKKGKWTKDDGKVSLFLKKMLLWFLLNFDLGYIIKSIFYIAVMIIIVFYLF